jgi:SAM-dependent methyltransferase
MIEHFIKPHIKYIQSDGIYKILDSEFENRLNRFLKRYAEIHNEEEIETVNDYEALPNINNSKHPFEWKLRQEGLKIIEKEITTTDNNILEIGTFYSWLTHHLSKKNNVVCLDYFDSKVYGLGSKQHFKNNNWIAIQCKTEEPTFLQPIFDVIIVNHALQFYTNIEKGIEELKKLLKPGGKLILLGVYLFKDSSKKQLAVQQFVEEYKNKHQFDIFLNPTKGFLDWDDKHFFYKEHIELNSYKSCFIQNIKSKIIPSKPFYCYGIYKNPKLA